MNSHDGAIGVVTTSRALAERVSQASGGDRLDGADRVLAWASDHPASPCIVEGEALSIVRQLRGGRFHRLDDLNVYRSASHLRWGGAGWTFRLHELDECAHLSRRLVDMEDEHLGLLGVSEEMERVRHDIRTVASFRSVGVLILGDTGTGKELVARGIHQCGRPDDPFVSVNCAAVPGSLFESELFGHESGAFTDARSSRLGLFETAGEGSLFLDEVAETAPHVQAKLLRTLEERTYRRVGGNESRPVQCRIIAATNRRAADNQEVLRPDLFFRLAHFTVHMPTLAERAVDVPLLADHFLERFRITHGRGPTAFTDQAYHVLRSHAWRGHVRELRVTVENAAIRARESVIDEAPLLEVFEARRSYLAAERIGGDDGEGREPLGDDEPLPLREVERVALLSAYARAGGNIAKAARTLRVPRTTLRDKLRRLGVTDESDC